MNPDTSDRSLHFIVRDDSYEQTLGYRHFLNHVLQQVNDLSPDLSAETFLRDIIGKMYNLETTNHYTRDYRKLFDCLDKSPVLDDADQKVRAFQDANKAIKEQAELDKIQKRSADWLHSPANRNEQQKEMFAQHRRCEVEAVAALKKIFGPAGGQDYGGKRLTLTGFMQGTKHELVTPIYGTKKTERKAYWNTIRDNYQLGDSPPADFYQSFEYESPGTGKKIPLMKIGTLERLASEKMEDGKLFSESELYKEMIGRHGKDAFVFLHPFSTAKNVGEWMEPIFQDFIKKPKPRPLKGTPPPEHKIDDLATLYWLVAQSTPVTSGGSGLANVALEHLAYRLRKQGYTYEIPFTKDGVDLWAQAASLPLEDTKELKGFKSRFKEGLFFDTRKTDQEVEDYLRQRLQTDALLAPSPRTTSWRVE